MKELIDQYSNQKQQFIEQRDLAAANIQQLNGAIFAIEQVIKDLQSKIQSESGEEKNGDTDDKSSEQTS